MSFRPGDEYMERQARGPVDSSCRRGRKNERQNMRVE